ncbi:MAG: hypothetical protein V3T53_15245 [Phycisphaerales bacterium]
MLTWLRSIFYASQQTFRSRGTSSSTGGSGVRHPKTVVLVGHCGPDMFMLKTAVGRALPEATIVSVNDVDALGEYRTPEALLLVNRELDGRFHTQSGIDIIREITQQSDGPVTMLISNLQDAQAQAIAAGAKPGFGKSQLYDKSTTSLLTGAMQPE